MMPLAAIMKSSIRFLARFGFSAASRLTVSPSNSARTSMVSSSSAPWSWRCAFSRCATPSWSFRFSASPGTAASAGGGGPSPCSHAPTAW